MKVILILLFLRSVNPLMAQDRRLDSLKALLQQHPKEDTIKAQLTFEVATGTFRYSQAKSESLFIKGFEMADRLCWKRGKVKPLVWRGWHYLEMGMPGKGMEDLLTSLKIADDINDTLMMAYARIALGGQYPDIKQQKKYALEAITYAAAVKDTTEMMSAYELLSFLYLDEENWSEFDKSTAQILKLAGAVNDKLMESRAYSMIGNKLESTGHLRESLPYFLEQVSYTRDYIARGFVGSRGPLGGQCAHISKIFITLKECDNAFYWAREAERSMGDSPMSRAPVYEAYYNYYKNCGDVESALKYRLLFDSAQEVNSNFEAGQKIQEAIARSELEKKDALAKAEIQKQKTTILYTIGGVVLLLCFATYAFYNYQRKRKYEKQQALATERLRISRELHDDIGSTLGSIAVYSDVAKKRSAKDEVSEEALGKIGKASRELIEKMGDIIWNLNPENENFEQLLNRMQAFAAMILAPRNIHVDFDFDESLKSLALSPEHRKNLFLIFKESIHNIVKHAEANNVSINLRKENDALKIRIQDDGKGFEMNGVQSVRLNGMGGNGLKSMTDRAKTMLAEFNIGSKVNEGTTVDLSINI